MMTPTHTDTLRTANAAREAVRAKLKAADRLLARKRELADEKGKAAQAAARAKEAAGVGNVLQRAAAQRDAEDLAAAAAREVAVAEERRARIASELAAAEQDELKIRNDLRRREADRIAARLDEIRAEEYQQCARLAALDIDSRSALTPQALKALQYSQPRPRVEDFFSMGAAHEHQHIGGDRDALSAAREYWRTFDAALDAPDPVPAEERAA
jgi:hypothetical protein